MADRQAIIGGNPQAGVSKNSTCGGASQYLDLLDEATILESE